MRLGPEAMLKAWAWEQAKGALRAAVAAMSSIDPPGRKGREDIFLRWKKLHDLVETFITEVEDEGLME